MTPQNPNSKFPPTISCAEFQSSFPTFSPLAPVVFLKIPIWSLT